MSSFSLAQDGNTPLHCAAFYGHVAVAEMLIAAGAPVNRQDDLGGTPLFIAALDGRLEVVRLLLRHGADKELKDCNGKKPVDLVCTGGEPHKAAITALLR